MTEARRFVLFTLQVLVIACTSTGKGTVEKTTPRLARLDPKAEQELEALGYREYEGSAVISDETGQKSGVPSRVSFDPASGPICSSGSPYSVWYADRHAEDLIVMLDGGGACWSSLCNASDAVEDTVSDFAQILAFPDLPYVFAKTGPRSDVVGFSTWNAVSIPYCDGSVFMGDNDVTDPETGDVRHHRGRRNLAAGLDVAVAHFPDPKRVLLVGWSGGGYGTLTAMMTTRLRYPDAELYVLDDSGPGLVNLAEATDIDERLAEWKYDEIIPKSCTQCDGGRGQFAPLFEWMLERDVDVRIGVASYYQDPTISSFLRMRPESYEPLLHDTLTPIFKAHPDRFKRFMLPGQEHVLTNSIVTTAGGLRFDLWTFAMTYRDDTTWADVQANCAYTCCHPDRASCDADPECMAVLGRDALKHSDGFRGCIARPSACDDHVTCALSPDSASDPACYLFQNSCIPNGWEAVDCSTVPGCSA